MGHQTTGQGAGHDSGHGHGPPPPPEPKTPMWLPALGAALFLVAALAWGLCDGAAATGKGGDAPAATDK